MEADTATFEVWLRGRKVKSFTGARATARAQAEAHRDTLNVGRLAWIKERKPGTPFMRRLGGWLATGFFILIALLEVWAEW